MSKITPVYIDLESFWSTEHTLSKMSPTEYVMHPLTEIQSISIGVGDGAIGVLFGEKEIRAMLAKIDWSNAMAIGHNMSGFDALILRWRFGINPKMWGCTAAMARSAHSKTQVMLGGKPLVGVSLKKLAAEFGVGRKLDFEATNTKGKRLEDFTREEMQAMREYNRVDTELCRSLFKQLIKGFPKQELLLIDMTTRMLVDPQFELDMPMLEVALSMERDAKHKALLALAKDIRKISGVDVELDWHDEEAVAEFVRSEMASAARFGSLLQRLGVPIPMKQSKTDPDKDIPALAKTDEEFIKLQDHSDPVVAAAARTRLQVKSTLLETRLEAFMKAGKCVGGMLPVPLKYAGADTTGRWSGEQYNCQNLPRINPKTPKASDALRNSLRAPKGMKVIVSDLSGIELRVNMFLWKVQYAMDLFKADPEKADLYRYFAANNLFRVPEHEITKDQRQIGKVCLAEGTLVLTDSGLKPIESVGVLDLVWDGVEWVNHDGPMYMGEKETITYDGLTATPDHKVWLEDGRQVSIGVAAAQSLRLARTGAGRAPLGFGGAGLHGGSAEQGIPARPGTLHGVRQGDLGVLRQPAGGEDSGVPVMQAEMRSSSLDAPALGSRQATLHEPERPGVPPVRRAGGAIPVSDSSISGGVGAAELGVGEGQGVGQDGQQRALRSREPSLGDAQAEHGQSDPVTLQAIPSVSAEQSGREVCGQHTAQPDVARANGRADCGAVQQAVSQTKRRVWDILNAGPRHRFTANDRLVSNCHLGLGFGAGAATFQKVAKLMGGIDMPLYPTEGQGISASETVDAYRSGHPEIVKGWKQFQASLPNIMQGIESSIDPWGMCVVEKHAVRLPSGRRIHYPDLHREVDANGKSEWWYGNGRTRARIYAGKGVENLVQALARDVIAEHMVKFYQATGLTPALTVHDELVYVVPDADAEGLLAQLQGIMRAGVSWWPELVTWSEGDVGDTYGAVK